MNNPTTHILVACVTALLLTPLTGLEAANAATATNDFLLFETGPFLKENAYADCKTPPTDWHEQSGALRLNAAWQTDRSLPWYIEDQQLGGDYVAAGLAYGNKDEIRWGLKVIDWGFAQMTPDGEFKHPDSYHSGAFFIEASARALLLIGASPLHAEFKDRVAAIKPQLLTAARWMAQPEIRDRFWNPTTRSNERPYGHRRFLDAAALGLAGVLCKDKDLIASSAALVRAGLSFQRSDGVIPEKGGHDSHYQSYSLMYACRYYALVADDALRAEMKPAMEKGYAWLLTRVREDGSVDHTGNSRTGFGQEKTRNKAKQKWLEYRFAAISLAYWAQIMNNPELEKTARRLFDADRRLRADPAARTWDGY
jgi:hypothetical protein